MCHAPVVITVRGREAAKQLLNGRIRAGGKKLKMEEFAEEGKDVQCGKSAAWGHSEFRCPQLGMLRYGLCAERHRTSHHVCQVAGCGKKGKCQHLQAKCTNCDGERAATCAGCGFKRSAIGAARAAVGQGPIEWQQPRFRTGSQRRQRNPRGNPAGGAKADGGRLGQIPGNGGDHRRGIGQRISHDVVYVAPAAKLLGGCSGDGNGAAIGEGGAGVDTVTERGEGWHCQPPRLSKYHEGEESLNRRQQRDKVQDRPSQRERRGRLRQHHSQPTEDSGSQHIRPKYTGQRVPP